MNAAEPTSDHGCRPDKDGRHPLRVQAFEDGIDLIDRDRDLEEKLLSGSILWWRSMAPLTRNERSRVLSDVKHFAVEAKRVRLSAKKDP